MIRLLKGGYDKLLPVLALAALLAGCLWSVLRQPDIRRLRPPAVAPRLTGSAYEPANLRLAENAAAVWSEPSRAHGGFHDLFAPPAAGHDGRAPSAVASAPRQTPAGSPPFGLELITVKPEQYRLQLAGYFGGPDDYLVAFVSPGSPGILLARAGRRFEELGLAFKSFALMKVPVAHKDGWPVCEVTGLAVLQDDRTGAEVVLDGRTRRLTGASVAVLRLQTGGGKPRELRESDAVSDGEASYRVEHIRLDPAEVVVVRQDSCTHESATIILHPVADNGPQLADTSSRRETVFAHPSDGLATNAR